MCKSASEGGQRCAAHTRPAFQRALSTAHQPGHEAEFDNAAIEHATTSQGRTEVEALLSFATNDRVRLRIENLLSQADQLRTRREAVNAEVNQQLRARRGDGSTTDPSTGATTANTDTRPALRLVHSTTEVPCDTCGGSGEDYDGYWGCEDCSGTGIEPAPASSRTAR